MQVYVVTVPEDIGPVELEQELTPPVPEIDQFKAPLGAAELFDPVTVSVKITDPPRVKAPDDDKATTGVAVATVVDEEEATAAIALYALSPRKVNVAP